MWSLETTSPPLGWERSGLLRGQAGNGWSSLHSMSRATESVLRQFGAHVGDRRLLTLVAGGRADSSHPLHHWAMHAGSDVLRKIDRELEAQREQAIKCVLSVVMGAV